MIEGYGYIYRIYKIDNQKSYVGKTTGNIIQRIQSHFKANQDTGIAIAVRKHGKDAFDWEILEICPNSDTQQREIFWIASLDTYKGFGYNRTPGGDGSYGIHHPFYGKKLTEEHKEKLSQAKIGKYSGENHPQYGTRRSEETKRKISAAQTGEKSYWYGTKRSEKMKRQISRKMKEHWRKKREQEKTTHTN